MHVYIYDSFLGNKKYESIIAKIETRLTDLGLNGKIIRLGPMQSLSDSVDTEIKKGAKTIVAVGGNELLHNCINSIMNFYENNDYKCVPLGFIPINAKSSSIASLLGVPVGIDACNILSARRVEEIDIGKINKTYFISEAIINTSGTTVNVNNSYTIEITEAGEIGIINIPNDFDFPSNIKSSAQDNKLEFCIKTKKANKLLSMGNKENTNSVFSFDTLTVENKNGVSFLLDSVKEASTPAEIRVSNKKLNIIIGKSRSF